MTNKWSDDLNKDRIAGAAKEAKGSVKEAFGKTVGDAKLTAEGRSDKAEGEVQNAVSGLKDALMCRYRKYDRRHTVSCDYCDRPADAACLCLATRSQPRQSEKLAWAPHHAVSNIDGGIRRQVLK